MSFSLRLAHDARFSAAPDPSHPIHLAMRNHLLVCRAALERFSLSVLEEVLDSRLVRLTTLFEGLPTDEKIPDVDIYELEQPPANIFGAVGRLYADGRLKGLEPGEVAPNHVILPANEGHSCPSGPPRPLAGHPRVPGRTAPPHGSPPQVTVIDSGWQWSDAWPANPLDGRVDPGDVAQAERLPTLAEATAAGAGIAPWRAGAPDTPGETVAATGRLVALAGHANFVAGVVARHCRSAEIRVVNHNGAFQPTADDPITEATVARSLCRSAGADVIDLGFAFRTLDETVSCIWERAFEYLAWASHRLHRLTPMVVAPAGNQQSTAPRYPAALGYQPGSAGRAAPFDTLVGVASIDRRTKGRSAFSNSGPWVTCAAIGSGVASTFLHLDMPLEDDGDKAPARDFRANSWARWRGTSFAAPKVVAGIANELAAGAASPLDAWQEVVQGLVPGPVLGYVLDRLG